MSEFWISLGCCVAEQPQPTRRRRIDRSMIGEPTNFVHTTHVGSGEMFNGGNNTNLVCICSTRCSPRGATGGACGNQGGAPPDTWWTPQPDERVWGRGVGGGCGRGAKTKVRVFVTPGFGVTSRLAGDDSCSSSRHR
ncbi:CDC42 small effector protein 2-like isoform X2 [Petromyzon marinus]|uniref:CDC42 small effector protein 2-like isoform X2 n=1 Tax=Petromyzon marinus TaxID=7757 RepID=UPI003F705D89